MFLSTQYQKPCLMWLLTALLLLFIPTTQAQTTKLQLAEKMKINQPVYEDGEVDFSVKVKNTTTNETLQYDDICISVKIDSNSWDNLHCTGNIAISPQQEIYFSKAESFKGHPVDTYKLVAKAKFDGVWYEISPMAHNRLNFEVLPTPTVEVSLLPTHYTFSQQKVNFSSNDKSFTLRNMGNQTVNGQATLVGSNASHFYLNSSKSFTLIPNQYTTFKVKFRPTSSGNKTARLRVSGSGFSEEVNLSGSAIQDTVVDTPDPTPQPDATLTTCIGYNYEQEVTNYSNLKSPRVSIQVPNTTTTTDSIVLEADASIDSRGYAFFYWCTDEGGFSTNGASANFDKVVYHLPESGATANISVLVGDSLGFIDTDSVKLQAANDSGTDTGGNGNTLPKPTITQHDFVEMDALSNPTAISIRWSNSSRGFYTLERSTDNINYSEIQCNTNSVGIGTTDRTPQPNTTYWYRLRISNDDSVSCVGSSGWSSYSEPYKVEFLLASTEPAPTITGHDFVEMDVLGNPTAISIRWDNSSKGFYDLERSTDKVNYSDVYCTTSSRGIGTIDRTPQQPNTTYWYRLRISNDESAFCNGNAGWSSYSEPYKVEMPVANNEDSDGDGVADAEDAFPLDANESVDSDNDGVGNNADSDDDNDNLPDEYENQYAFLNPLDAGDALLDNDGDGTSNLEEYEAGTDPSFNDMGYKVVWTAISRDVQHIPPYSPIDEITEFKTTNAKVWASIRVEDFEKPIGAKFEWYDPEGNLHSSFINAPANIYGKGRAWVFNADISIAGTPVATKLGDWSVQILVDIDNGWELAKTHNFTIIQSVDADGDGIPDSTDPDDDNDNLPDTYEDQYAFLNSLDANDAALDEDGDGVSNLEEYQQGSNPDDFVAPVSIRGTVKDPHGHPLSDVIVTLKQPDGSVASYTTAIDGHYQFTNLPAKQAYQVFASGENLSITNHQDVDIKDTIDIFKHVIGTDKLDLLLQCVAADVNQDNQISVKDYIITFGQDDEFPFGYWRFLTNTDFTCDSLDKVETSFSFNNLVTNQVQQNFVAIRLGDIDDSWLGKSGLVAYYCFDDSNDLGKDCSGNRNDGTPSTTGVSAVTGIMQTGAVQFGGYYDPGSIHVPNSASLKFTEELTVSYFVKLNSVGGMDGYGSYNPKTAIGHNVLAKSHDRSGFITKIGTADGQNTRIYFANNAYASPKMSHAETIPHPILDEWLHVAQVFSVEENKYTLYLNGEFITEQNDETIDFTIANGQDLYLGKFSTVWYPMHGMLDELRFYNRALSADEITALAAVGNFVEIEADTDNDGIPDNYENQYAFLNPADASDAALDEDNDGLSNLEEYQQGTDPTSGSLCENTPVTGIPQAECETLIALYDNTEGNSWTNNTDWKTPSTPCSWYGVTCSGGHVIQILLDNNQLSGEIPDLSALSKLSTLEVSNNDICRGQNIDYTGYLDIQASPLCGNPAISLLTPTHGATDIPVSGQIFSWKPDTAASYHRMVISTQPDFANFIDEATGGDGMYCADEATCLTASMHTSAPQSYTAMNLAPNTTYYWKVRASTSAHIWSEVHSFTTVDIQQPVDSIDSFTLAKSGFGSSRVKPKGETEWPVNCKVACEETSHDFALGTALVLRAAPQPGSEFEQWQCDNGLTSDEPNWEFTLDTPATCTVTFALLENDPDFATFNVQAIGSGNGNLSIGQIQLGMQGLLSYPLGRNIWVKATPADAFSQFKAWSGDCVGDKAQVKVTMDSDKTCYAEFVSASAEVSGNIVEQLYRNPEFAADYPQVDNTTCLQQAMDIAMVSAMDLIQSHLQLKGSWPVQLNGIELYEPTPITEECTQSVKMLGNSEGNYLQVQVMLQNASGESELVNLQTVPPMDDNNAVLDWLWRW